MCSASGTSLPDTNSVADPEFAQKGDRGERARIASLNGGLEPQAGSRPGQSPWRGVQPPPNLSFLSIFIQ